MTTPPLCVGHRVGVGHQRDLLEERVQRGRLVGARPLLLELARDADQLAQVVHPAFVLRVAAGLQLAQVAGPVQHRLEHRARGAVRAGGARRAARSSGSGSRGSRSASAAPARTTSSATSSAAPKEMPLALGEHLDAGLGAVADAAARGVQDAAQAHHVVRVGDHPQVGERVADLAPLVEAHAADHLVRQPDADEHFLEHPGLRVGAVEDRDVGRRDGVLVVELVDLLGDPRGLVVLVLGDVALDLLARSGLGPQVLRLAVRIAGDDRVGRGQDRLGRAVVLLQQDRGRVRVVALELEDVADRRAAERVDRLVGVADDGQLGRRPRRRAVSSRTRTYWAWLVSWYSSTSTCRNRRR